MIRSDLTVWATCCAGWCWLVLAAGTIEAADPTAGKVDFNRDIRPILAANCFACHGPDDEKREAGLRLDLIEKARQPLDSGATAIVPFKPADSELVTRIYTIDETLKMPPADSNKTLTSAQKTLLQRWIVEGATVDTHWSFAAPRRPAMPQVRDTGWVRNEIDRFVLDRLEQEQLAPAAAADRATLVRRLYLDLIGLLPTPEEAEAFIEDSRPEAYEELVDRLLDSPHYGERWARRWLDLARYADTNGYEKDRQRSIWPYRDWVIRALNADLPFDRFTIEQIAGDLLPQADLNSRVATGFHRNTMTNEEGGIDVEEFRFYSVVDRVSTTSAVWLGLTLGCAQCHSHKFDAFSQREYYQLFAFLNNADEPELEVPQAKIAAERAAIEQQIVTLTSERDARFDADKFQAWLDESAKAARRWTSVAPKSAVSTGNATMTTLADQSVLATGDKPNQDTYLVELVSPLPRVTGIRLEVLPHESLPMNGPGRAPLFSEGDFMLGELSVAAASSDGEQPRTLELCNASQDYASEKTSAALAIDGDLDTGWSIKGRTGQAHQAVFQFKQPLEATPATRLLIKLEQRYIHQMTIGRFRLSFADHDAPAASPAPAEVEAALSVPSSQRGPAQLQLLKQHYLDVAPELAEINKQLDDLRKKLPKQPTTLVIEERDAAHARATRIAHRGEFLSPRESVEPGVPAVLHSLPADGPRNRLALARWLVDPANPLVARVTMNRHWQAFFGRGLVRTSEDFGVRGDPPSHPELLDYLATEFVARGWSIKHMQRLIVTSATYRQSSQMTPELARRDPDNVLLARGPRFRVEAEMVRDMALCVSGLLNDAIGGPSVFPPQPAGVTDLAYGAGSWPTSEGRDRYRRGLYTHAKRTSPYAAFTTFDGPSGENCVVRRERSNTPLQALTLLNDTVFTDAARGLASRIIKSAASDTIGRVRLAMHICLVREPSSDELEDLVKFHDAQLERIRQGALDAKTIAGAEAIEMDLAELAAWTLTARAILNLDEFVTKQQVDECVP